jgi:antibiotic biosynthesis monooxygenase (ABM) superfamily enzyme
MKSTFDFVVLFFTVLITAVLIAVLRELQIATWIKISAVITVISLVYFAASTMERTAEEK